jgi:DNA-directed RNA polymerase sigma subunit (sigma70/sigma32)
MDPALENRLVGAAQTGDDAARAELLEAFTPFIGRISRGYPAPVGIGQPELMQAGAAGLFTALDRYNAARGMPFWPYASWWVRNAMQTVSGPSAGGTDALMGKPGQCV